MEMRIHETKKHTVGDVKKILREMDKKMGTDFAKLEVKVSKRMTRALGSAVCGVKYDRFTNKITKITPLQFKFSYFFLNAMLTDDQFRQIVVHEWTHLYANNLHQDNVGHDSRYKKACKDIGYKEISGMYCDREIGWAFRKAISNYKLK